MSLSLAVHLAGYELSRASVMALFTSDRLGFGRSDDNNSGSGSGAAGGGLSALPMAVGCVSPFSIGLLWFYGKTLHRGGPSYALRIHTWTCAIIQIVSGWLLISLDNYLRLTVTSVPSTISSAAAPEIHVHAQSCSQTLLFLLFVFQNAYVQLLYNQHWAFISSVLTPDEGSTFFAPIAGLGSISSTVAAGLVSTLIQKIGLVGLLYAAGASYILSATLADTAFRLARRGGFEPIGDGGGVEKRNNSQTQSTKSVSTPPTTPTPPPPTTPTSAKKNTSESDSESTTSFCNNKEKNNNIFEQAYILFQRVPVLGALFIEVILSQCLSSLVNFIYLFTLKSTITDDALRAGWSGNFYA